MGRLLNSKLFVAPIKIHWIGLVGSVQNIFVSHFIFTYFFFMNYILWYRLILFYVFVEDWENQLHNGGKNEPLFWHQFCYEKSAQRTNTWQGYKLNYSWNVCCAYDNCAWDNLLLMIMLYWFIYRLERSDFVLEFY